MPLSTHNILLMWDNSKSCFKFINYDLHFTAEETALVMGLPFEYKINLFYYSGLRARHFEYNKEITRPQLEKGIKNPIKDNHVNEDVVGLIVM